LSPPPPIITKVYKPPIITKVKYKILHSEAYIRNTTVSIK